MFDTLNGIFLPSLCFAATQSKKKIANWCGIQIWVIPVNPLHFLGLLFLICTTACSHGTLLGGNYTLLGVECQQNSNDLISMALCNIGLITSVGLACSVSHPAFCPGT